MVIKTVQMGIPVLISRSGFTAWGVELARRADLTLIGRAKGKRFIALAGEQRIVYDADAAAVEDEPRASSARRASPKMPISLPPTLALPHKGGGNASVSSLPLDGGGSGRGWGLRVNTGA